MNKTLLKKALLLRNFKNVANTTQQTIRNSGHGTWSYRTPPPPPSKRAVMIAEGLGAICWFWILWHLATEPEHVYGEWPYVPPSSWRDEDLGIPPDSQGSLIKKESKDDKETKKAKES